MTYVREQMTLVVEHLFEDGKYVILFTIDGKETDYSVPIQDHLSEDKLINTADLVDNIEDEIKKSVRKYRRTNRATTTANRAERQ
ncbi:unnamed protein product [Rotaria sordida]|uniref:Uncharacterized protein n=1 Tax=Rotaria sordida TaxID=392033 RepID=A0A815NDD6_9BILA|nr:unnamed protein product [Rotaria sordida]CAF1361707.1 unnamed protein product [Rotaria sordida]CAF1428078.1 unnamed protein product [Rotaria sordida]